MTSGGEGNPGATAVDADGGTVGAVDGGTAHGRGVRLGPGARRPWWDRLTARTAWPAWANAVAVVGVMAVTLSQLHPELLTLATTTAGGDTGAHVALPAFLESHLLVHGQVTGWDPGWYDGFPLYTFYFPLPGLLTVLVNAVVTYDVAFKLVTVLGSLLLPICAWASSLTSRTFRSSTFRVAISCSSLFFVASKSCVRSTTLASISSRDFCSASCKADASVISVMMPMMP